MPDGLVGPARLSTLRDRVIQVRRIERQSEIEYRRYINIHGYYHMKRGRPDRVRNFNNFASITLSESKYRTTHTQRL